MEQKSMRLITIYANGLFNRNYAGGDIHLLNVLRYITSYDLTAVTCYSSHHLQRYIEPWNIKNLEIILTAKNGDYLPDKTPLEKVKMFSCFFKRMVRTLTTQLLDDAPNVAYAATDYWWDVIPLFFSRAHHKVVCHHMTAPSLRSALGLDKSSIKGNTFANLHYWFSQRLSYLLFRLCKRKTIITSNHSQQSYFHNRGFAPSEVVFIPCGIDVEEIEKAKEVHKKYDLIWMGRNHPQKGIVHLFILLQWLKDKIPNFKALLLGDVRQDFQERVESWGLKDHVTFGGFVFGKGRYNLIKSSKVLVSTSSSEGIPISIGEAIACDIGVVTYNLQGFDHHFGKYAHLIKPLDIDTFCKTTKEVITASLPISNEQYRRENNWKTIVDKIHQTFNRYV